MCGGFGLLALVPMAVLLTISFFVLFAAQKVEKGSLKTFGLVAAVLLWVAAAVVFSAGIMVMANCGRGGCGPMHMHKQMMMKGMMPGCHMKDMPMMNAPSAPGTLQSVPQDKK